MDSSFYSADFSRSLGRPKMGVTRPGSSSKKANSNKSTTATFRPVSNLFDYQHPYYLDLNYDNLDRKNQQQLHQRPIISHHESLRRPPSTTNSPNYHHPYHHHQQAISPFNHELSSNSEPNTPAVINPAFLDGSITLLHIFTDHPYHLEPNQNDLNLTFSPPDHQPIIKANQNQQPSMSVSPLLSGSVHLNDRQREKLTTNQTRTLPVSSFPHLTKNVASRLARLAAGAGVSGSEQDSSFLTFDLLKGENGSNNSSESLDSNATLVSEDSTSSSLNPKLHRTSSISQGAMSNSASISSSLYYVDYNGGQGASSAPPGSLASNSNRSSICSNSTLTQSSIGSFHHLNPSSSLDEDANEGEAEDLQPLPPPPPELRIGAPTKMFSASSATVDHHHHSFNSLLFPPPPPPSEITSTSQPTTPPATKPKPSVPPPPPPGPPVTKHTPYSTSTSTFSTNYHPFNPISVHPNSPSAMTTFGRNRNHFTSNSNNSGYDQPNHNHQPPYKYAADYSPPNMMSSFTGSLPRRPAPPVPVRATTNGTANTIANNQQQQQSMTSTSTSSASSPSPSSSSSSGVSSDGGNSTTAVSSSLVSSSTLDVQSSSTSTSTSADYDHLKKPFYAGGGNGDHPQHNRLLAPDYTNLIAMAEGGGAAGGGGGGGGDINADPADLRFQQHSPQFNTAPPQGYHHHYSQQNYQQHYQQQQRPPPGDGHPHYHHQRTQSTTHLVPSTFNPTKADLTSPTYGWVYNNQGDPVTQGSSLDPESSDLTSSSTNQTTVLDTFKLQGREGRGVTPSSSLGGTMDRDNNNNSNSTGSSPGPSNYFNSSRKPRSDDDDHQIKAKSYQIFLDEPIGNPKLEAIEMTGVRGGGGGGGGSISPSDQLLVEEDSRSSKNRGKSCCETFISCTRIIICSIAILLFIGMLFVISFTLVHRNDYGPDDGLAFFKKFFPLTGDKQSENSTYSTTPPIIDLQNATFVTSMTTDFAKNSTTLKPRINTFSKRPIEDGEKVFNSTTTETSSSLPSTSPSSTLPSTTTSESLSTQSSSPSTSSTTTSTTAAPSSSSTTIITTTITTTSTTAIPSPALNTTTSPILITTTLPPSPPTTVEIPSETPVSASPSPSTTAQSFSTSPSSLSPSNETSPVDIENGDHHNDSSPIIASSTKISTTTTTASTVVSSVSTTVSSTTVTDILDNSFVVNHTTEKSGSLEVSKVTAAPENPTSSISPPPPASSSENRDSRDLKSNSSFSSANTVAPIVNTTSADNLAWEKVSTNTVLPLSPPETIIEEQMTNSTRTNSSAAAAESQLNPVPLESGIIFTAIETPETDPPEIPIPTTTTTTTETPETSASLPSTTLKVPLAFELPVTNSPFFEDSSSEVLETIKKSELLEAGRGDDKLTSSVEFITTTTTTLSPEVNSTNNFLTSPSLNGTTTTTESKINNSSAVITSRFTLSTPSSIITSTTTIPESTTTNSTSENSKKSGFFRRIPQRISKMRSYLSNRFLGSRTKA